jgi:hypothetical protein
MSRITNKTIEIWTETRDWQGTLTSTLEGTYDVYLEEVSTKEVFSNPYDEGSHTDAIQDRTKGFFILHEEVPLDGKAIRYGGEQYAIKAWDRFWNRKGVFHHIEATFK